MENALTARKMENVRKTTGNRINNLKERSFLILDTRAEDFGRGMKLFSSILWGYENIKINFYRVRTHLA